MAIIKATDIVTKVLTTLQDDGTHWTKSELLGWFNDGQREIVKYRPDASVAHRQVVLVTGTVQAIPATDLRLIGFVRNMGVGGAVPGRAIRDIDRDDLDTQNPDWHMDTAAAAVERGIFDDRDPKVFYVYPPQPGSGMGTIEIITSVPPVDCTISGVNGAGADTVISLDDIYANDLYNYTMAQALSKEAEYANPSAGSGYRQVFMQSVAGKVQVDEGSDPEKAQEK